jgi:hypothetical protein
VQLHHKDSSMKTDDKIKSLSINILRVAVGVVLGAFALSLAPQLVLAQSQGPRIKTDQEI